eukprot:6285247-Lingulodinium_polyedra.AAC.1
MDHEDDCLQEAERHGSAASAGSAAKGAERVLGDEELQKTLMKMLPQAKFRVVGKKNATALRRK